MLFGLQGRDESRKMQWGDVKHLTDENGDDYLQFEERDTKAKTGEENGSRAFAPKMLPNKAQPERCPVVAYKQGAREATTCGYERRRKSLLSGH